ncbi:Chitin synthase, class 7 [Ceratobasidium sp. 414]|nr:Chitin synthase, class 7 [Ceratobasidium sp. 414]
MKFGSFDSICSTAALVVCPLLGGDGMGIEPECYSRNVMLGSYVFFQPAVAFVHLLAMCMTIIMILHIRSKYTAVGRKEILTFFYLYLVVELLAIFLDTEIIPTANNAYPWIAAVYTGLVAATYCCLLINGFIGFQFAEDGTPLSIWGLRGACLAMWALTFFISICTFQAKAPGVIVDAPGPLLHNPIGLTYRSLGFAGFSSTRPIGLWVLHFIWPAVCVVTYVVAQLVLVLRTLQDRWPLGDIVLGMAAFVVAQVILFGFGNTICTAVKHYIDGLFFYSLCILLGVMMVYKYWDSITGDDLEFSVGNKAGMWELKDEPAGPYGFGVNKFVDGGPSMGGTPANGTRASLFVDAGDARAHSLIGGVSGQDAYVGSGYVGGAEPRSR